MKILYITEIDMSINSGVLNKMNDQIEAWVDSGHEVYIASIPASAKVSISPLITFKIVEHRTFVNDWIHNILSGALLNYGNKILSFGQCQRYIHDVNPDIIYLREMVSLPGISKLLKKHGVVLESNTLFNQELKTANKLVYYLFRKQLFKNVNGFIGVTKEITDQFIKYGKPTITIPNGIKINTATEISAPQNARAQIIMVGSPGQAWQGMDKFKRLAQLIPTADFHLVGETCKDSLYTNLFCHGYLSKEELIRLYEKMDVGVGTLALHRKGMNEACPLKVREYASIGLPIILAYNDPDFKGAPYALEISNCEDNIEKNIMSIKTFIDTWRGKRVPLKEVESLISIERKESVRIKFIQKIIKNELH
jgi:hypothetical protein